MELEVKELTNNRMVVSFTGQEQEDLTNDGAIETIDYTLDLTFVK